MQPKSKSYRADIRAKLRPAPPKPNPAKGKATRITEQDQEIWSLFARAVKPIRTRKRSKTPTSPTTDPGAPPPAILPPAILPPAKPILQPPSRATELPAVAGPNAPLAYLIIDIQPPGLDNSTWNKLRTGRAGASHHGTGRRLDLHAHTAQRAHTALHQFIHAAIRDQVRVVEIITGQGSGQQGGVLRRELPVWLNLPTLRPLLLAACYVHAANHGAVRLLLKRTR